MNSSTFKREDSISLRLLVGTKKPDAYAHTPPGAFAYSVALPLAALMLALSLWNPGRTDAEQQENGYARS